MFVFLFIPKKKAKAKGGGGLAWGGGCGEDWPTTEEINSVSNCI